MLYFSCNAVQYVLPHLADGISNDVFRTCLAAYFDISRSYSQSKSSWVGLNDCLLNSAIPSTRPPPNSAPSGASTKKELIARVLLPAIPPERTVFHGPGALVIFPGGPGSVGESRSDAGDCASSVSSEAGGWAVKGGLPGSRGKRLVEIQTL